MNIPTKKSQVVRIFGSSAKLARKLGVSRQCVDQWDENLTERRQNELIGVTIRVYGRRGMLMLDRVADQEKTDNASGVSLEPLVRSFSQRCRHKAECEAHGVVIPQECGDCDVFRNRNA